MPSPLHTSQAYAAELRTLKDRLLSMGSRCEALIRDAMLALERRDSSLAKQVESTDRSIDEDETAIDDLAVRILALRQPVGRDLRFLLTALKVVTDLERIGDEAVNIAERAAELADEPRPPPTIGKLPDMGSSAIAMLHAALDSFVEEDADKAERVLRDDDHVDATYGEIIRESLDFMRLHPDHVRPAMSVVSCAKYLERIADHATNIAEMVIFYVRGVDVRHQRKAKDVPT